MVKIFSIAFFFILSFGIQDNSVPCAVVEKANANYVFMNDTNLVQFNFPMLTRYRITATNAILVKQSSTVYKLVTKTKKDVDVFVSDPATMETVYAKKFKVIGSVGELSPAKVTNEIKGCFSIGRTDENYVTENVFNKFVYFCNEKDIKIECENGKVSNKTKTGFDVKPDAGAKTIRIKIIYRKAEVKSWEYAVGK